MSSPRQVRHPPTGPWAELATLLLQRRFTLGLTRRETADLADLSERSLQDIEGGTVGPRLEALTSLAAALGMDVVLTPRSGTDALPAGSWIVRRADPR